MAALLPSSRVPSYTRPKPPSPIILDSLNLFVALSISSRLNVFADPAHIAMLELKDAEAELGLLPGTVGTLPATFCNNKKEIFHC